MNIDITGKFIFIYNVSNQWYVRNGEFWEPDSSGYIRHYFREWCRQYPNIAFNPKLCDDILKTIKHDPRTCGDFRSVRPFFRPNASLAPNPIV